MSSLIASEVVRYGPEPGDGQAGFGWGIVCDVPTHASRTWEDVRHAYLGVAKGKGLSVVVSPFVEVPGERFPDLPKDCDYTIVAARVRLGYVATHEGQKEPTPEKDVRVVCTLEQAVRDAAAILGLTVGLSPELTALLLEHAVVHHRQAVVMSEAVTPLEARVI